MRELLTRDEFRIQVISRDLYRCVVCHRTDRLDAHHILERRLWTEPGEEGGYFMDNGATLCPIHHLEAERTLISCEELRFEANVFERILPSHFYDDQRYDKWGNPILANGMRLRGELFYDESVQKILGSAGVLHLFTKRVKYPRTFHLPWSVPGKDDRQLKDTMHFEGQRVVVTEKMDGENTSIYKDYIHARSLERATGSDRAEVWKVWSQIGHEIPDNWRICGENLLVKHSIQYHSLSTYFQVFSIWNEFNECVSWDEILDWCELLDLQTVPVLYRGMWDEAKIKALFNDKRQPDPMEGYVVRLERAFKYAEFRRCVAKFVRPNYVTTESHWRHDRMEKNHLQN
jgi:hypothetical protein